VRIHAAAAGIALLLSAHAPSGQTAHSLPSPEPFFAEVRRNLVRDQEEEVRFAYKERRTELQTNPFGHLGIGPTRLYEYTPTADKRGFYRRLLEEDGRAVADSPVERLRRRSGSSSTRSVDDVVAALKFTIDRREMLHGRPAIVVKFAPQPDAKPKTRAGRLVGSMVGDIWVDEDAHEVMQIEARTIEDITFGFGLIARIGKGTTMAVVRQAVEGDVWFPVSVRFNGGGRALLFRKLALDYKLDWFEYRAVGAAQTQ
jgi:hypothetical protein